MAGLAPLLLLRLSLSTCCVLLLLAACPSQAYAPCQQSSLMSAFDSFEDKHMPKGMPQDANQNDWQTFINENTWYCNRPTQSFIYRNDLRRVKEVCSWQGGKVYNKDKDNLCISKNKFQYVTVRTKGLGSCEIDSVTEETKHLILGCAMMTRNNNVCLPIHFQGNPRNDRPNSNARDCQAPR